ncbi:MAG: response regulator, partial [Myxococcota bacterium]
MSFAQRKHAPRVLYVDDEESARALLTRELTRAGFSVTTANGGLAGLRECETQAFDLVISDLRMPQLDGVAFLNELRAQKSRVPFVLVTGVPELDALRADVDAFDVLPKPWDPHQLVTSCRRAVESGWSSADAVSVVVLEDNPADMDLIEFYLEDARHKYRVLPASTLAQALAHQKVSQAELVISDLKLPDAHGLVVVEKLRRHAPDAAILIASGNDDEELAVQAIAMGAQDFFVKGHIGSLTLQRAMRFALERKRTERRLSHLAHYDELTGLANRKRLRSRLVEAIARASRANEAFGIVYIDLDGFKPVNDHYGHEAGDIVLKTVAKRMRQAVREYDSVARLGGDEFAV